MPAFAASLDENVRCPSAEVRAMVTISDSIRFIRNNTFSFGVPMRVRRVCGLAAAGLLMLVWMACGQVYRPVVIPCSTGGVPGCPIETNPTPGNFHAVLGISTNAPGNSGGAMQIDVSGDSIVGETSLSTANTPSYGFNPTHAAMLVNDVRVYVAAAASVFGGQDSVAYFTPVFQSSLATGFGTVNSVVLPSLAGQSSGIAAISEAGNVATVTLTNALSNVNAGMAISIVGGTVAGYDGTFPITSVSGTTLQYVNPVTGLAASSGGTAGVPPQPVFLNSTQTVAMYAANYNSNSVSSLSTVTNSVTNSVTVGTNPVSLAEMPNALKIYVANQGSDSISSLNAVDLSANPVTGFTGITPVWVVARKDNQKAYAVTQGDGQMVTIDTATDTVTSSLPVGAGANYIFLDPNLNRIYVTNPATAMVYVFAASGAANDTPLQLAAIPFASGSAACPLGCTPVSVTALLDGSRFYVASYENFQSPAACPDPTVSGNCIVPQLTVFNANNFAVQYPSTSTSPDPSTITLLTWPPFSTNQYAVPAVSTCAPAAVYTPSSTRFRLFTASSVDSTRVYVSMCDAGAVAVVNTTNGNTNNTGVALPPDTVVADLAAPQGPCTQVSCNSLAAITGFSIAANVITVQASNNFSAGQRITISGLTAGSFLDGVTLTVLPTGLTAAQFECYFTNADVASTTDAGTATPVQPSQAPIFLFTGQ